jgi:CRISPR-associated protein Csd2
MLKDKLGYPLQVDDAGRVVFDPTKRHDFVFLFDATNCNPNGDPENDNMPRQDMESRMGFVTDVCLKRKLRRFVSALYGTERANKDGGMNLFAKYRGLLVKEKRAMRDIVLKDLRTRLDNELKGKSEGEQQAHLLDLAKEWRLKDYKPTSDKDHQKLLEAELNRLDYEERQKYFRQEYWDVRMFGAVLTTGKERTPDEPEDSDSAAATPDPAANRPRETERREVLNAGQCVGPMQFAYAVSVDEIVPGLVPISSCTLPDNKSATDDSTEARSGTFGDKAGLPYALYLGTGHYSPGLDKHGVVTETDLALVWNGLRQLFNEDGSASRPGPGSMKALGAWVFTHEHRLGNYPVHKLFERISVSRRKPEDTDSLPPARCYQDYEVKINWKPGEIPGVTLTSLYNDWIV